MHRLMIHDAQIVLRLPRATKRRLEARARREKISCAELLRRYIADRAPSIQAPYTPTPPLPHL